MKKNINAKQYFLKDSVLTNIDDDRFNQAHIVNNLRMIIENTDPPYNIAVIGKWGIGKSSILRMLINKYKEDKDSYIIQEINAWKYEKESLKNVFLKQLWEGMNGTKVRTFDTIKRIYNEIISKDIPKNENKKSTGQKILSLLPHIVIIILVLIITFISFYVYKGIQIEWDKERIWRETILGYCKRVIPLIVTPLLLSYIALILKTLTEKENKKLEINMPIETTNDYETFLEETIGEKIGNNTNKKIITVIDDLDRLSIEKIVEALDAIKAFVDFKNCIFIIPFDDSILKEALNKERVSKISNEQGIIESELILDKLFQYKVYISPLLAFDIKEYAIELVDKHLKDFTKEYCEIEISKNVIKKVLIHHNVTTPRQVKKLINAFVSNVILAQKRTENGNADKIIFSTEEAKLQIAKISVLQVDYNEFYDVLFKNFNYINEILEIYNDSEITYNKINDDLKQFFHTKEKEEKPIIKREYESLINFLNSTKRYTVDNLAPYMYLAQDEISMKTGDSRTNASSENNISNARFI